MRAQAQTQASTSTGAILWVNDTLFILDVVLNFFTAFEIENNVIIHLGRIWRRYLRTWFTIDFISSIPLDSIIEPVLLANGTGQV